jgi:putative ATPase
VAATTENPSFSVISPLLSRSLLITLHSLNNDEIKSLLDRALTEERGLNGAVTIDETASDMIVRLAGGDARRALTVLEASAAVAVESGKSAITEDHVSLASDHNVVRYDKSGDQHYDVISAFIKSVRGSDVDAALHYLARMIEAGEDPRFIARRLLILASEDVGLADNDMLVLANAAMQTVAFIGMPEARITLAHVTTAMCLAPKSNSAYVAIDTAIADVRSGNIGQVPPHLRDSHYQRAGSLGHGVGYIYPHDLDEGVAGQQYLPDELRYAKYYVPAPRGGDAVYANVWTKIRSLLGRK